MYLDDIVNLSKSLDDHSTHYRDVLMVFSGPGMTLQLKNVSSLPNLLNILDTISDLRTFDRGSASEIPKGCEKSSDSNRVAIPPSIV